MSSLHVACTDSIPHTLTYELTCWADPEAPELSACVDRSSKSNRAAADVNEGTIVKHLCDDYGLPFLDQARLTDARKRTLDAHDHDEARVRLDRAQRQALLAFLKIKTTVKDRTLLKGAVTRFTWMGSNSELVDFRVHHEQGVTDFSVKGTQSGKGTAHNIGVKQLVESFKLPSAYKSINEKMYEICLREIESWFGPERADHLRGMTVSARKGAYTDTERDLCATVAHRMLQDFAKRLASTWRKLDRVDRVAFARLISGGEAGKHPDLFLVSVEGDQPTVSKASAISDDARVDLAVTGEGHALKLTLNGQEAFHIALSCTNGLGISPVCGRCFDRR